MSRLFGFLILGSVHSTEVLCCDLEASPSCGNVPVDSCDLTIVRVVFHLQ
ncbi:hypothetical protein A2U01_0094215, partial [Trifolium medium]|nr:hypothetical protein [Trifolium medium]